MELTNLFYTFEREYGRLLTPYEKEIIEEWTVKYEISQIFSALKESVFNGVVSFRYINKILERWNVNKESSDNEVEINIDNWLE